MANNAQQWAGLELDNSMTNLDMITDNTEPDYKISKLDTLQRAKEDKLTKLGSTTENKLQQQTDLSGLDTYEKLTAYLQNKNAEGVNYDDAGTIQEVLGRAMTYGLHKNEDGQEGFIDQSTGVFSPYRGDARGAYIGETANGQMKFGLRRGDKTYEDRYTSSLFSSYGWDSGPEGVKPEEKAAHMDQNLPAVLATALEKYIHSNAGQIAERTVGQGPATDEWRYKLGSGKYEYTSRNAPLWNVDYDVSGVKLQDDTPLPGDFEKKRRGTWDAEGNYVPAEEESSRLVNFAKGVPSTIGKSIVGVADSALEFVGKGIGDAIRLADKDSKFADFVEDTLDLGVKENRDKVIDSITGYDTKYSATPQLQLKALTAKIQERENVDPNIVTRVLSNVANTTKDVPFLNQLTETIAGVSSIIDVAEGGEVLEYVKTALSTPEIALESLGDIIVMAVAKGKGITARNKEIGALRKDIAADVKAKKGVDAEKAAKLKDLQAQRTMLDKGASVLSDNIGVVAVSSAYVNDAADEFKAMYGRDMTYTEKLGSLLVTVPFMMMDKAVAVGNIKGVQEVAKQFKKLEGAIPSQMLVQAAYKSAKAATTLGVAAVKEFLQEVPQTIQQEMLKYDMINEDFTINELSEENKAKLLNESVVAGALAFGAGAHMASPAVAAGALGSTIGMSKEKLQSILSKKDKAIESVPVEPTTVNESVVSVEDKDKAVSSLVNVELKLQEGGVISSEDLAELRDAEEVLASIKDIPKENRDIMTSIITTARSKYKTQIEEGGFEGVVLKSKEDLLSTMADIYTDDTADNSIVDEKLYELASTAGIVKTREEFTSIKKDFFSVEKEATEGKAGYITLGKELDHLINTTTPSSSKLTAKITKLNKFKASQEAYIQKANELVSDGERMAADYNASIGGKLELPEPTQFSGKVPKTGTTIKINFKKNNEGRFEVDMSGLDTIIEAKKRNIDGIKSTLATRSIKLAKLGIDENVLAESNIVLKTDGTAKGLKKKFENLEKRIKKQNINKIITIEDKFRDAYVKGIVDTNKSNTNLNEYQKDDNVLIVVPQSMKEADIKRALAKGGSLYNMIAKVKKAGATVHIEAGKGGIDNKILRAVRRALTKYGDKDTRYSPLSFGSMTLKPTEEAKALREAAKSSKKEAADKKLARESAEEVALGRSLEGESIKDILDSIPELKEAYVDTETATGVEKLKKRIGAKVVAAMNKLYKAKVALDIAIRSKADEAEIAMLKDTVEEIENTTHKKIQKKVTVELARRTQLKGVINEIKSIKEEGLSKEDEDSRIEEAILEAVGDVKVDVLTQPVSSKTFKANGANIPLSIKEYVKVSNEKSILQVIPVDVMFDDTLGIGKTSSEYIKDITKFISDTQGLSDKDAVTPKTNTNKRDAELHDSPAIALVLNEDGSVNQQVAMAMKLALGEYISFNMNMVDSEYKSKEDVAQMLGVLEGQVGPATYKLLKDKGVFNKTAATRVGTAVMDKLGLGFKKADGVEKELYNKLVADIGNMALLYGKNEGILEEASITVKEFGEAKFSDSGTYQDYSKSAEGTTVQFVRVPKRNEDGSLADKVQELTEEFAVVHEAIADESSFEKRPSKAPISISKARHTKEKVAKDVTGMEIPNKKIDGLKSPKKFMEELIKIKWKVDTKALDRLLSMDEDIVRSYLGYVTESDLEELAYDDRASAISKNREIDKSIEELSKLQEDIRNNKDKAYDLYFDWFYSSNGRYMMDSNTLNPQTDKLHRFIVQPESHRTTYTIKDGKVFEGKNDVSLEMDYAIAQAFGYAVDKESTKSIKNVAQGIKDLGYETIKEHVETGKEIELEDGTKLEVEHLSHALQALDVLQALEDGGEFTSSITAEYDAVTSGFGLKLMQFPILKDVWKWLNKVGVFKGKAKFDSMNDMLNEAGFYDSYQELAKNVVVTEDSLVDGDNKANALWSSMLPLLPTSVGGEVSKALRTLFKDPFMTFNYSAGIKSIKASLANKLSTDVIAKIVKGDPKYDAVAKQLATYTGMSVAELIVALKTKPATSIKLAANVKAIRVGSGKKGAKYNLKDALDGIMEETYGAKVEEIMNTNFGEFIEINNVVNSSFRAMFDAFKVKYDEEKAKYAVGELSEEAFNDIMLKLREDFPLIKGPLSNGLEDGIAIYDLASQNVTDDNARYRPAQTKTGSKEAGKRTLKVRHAIRDFEAAISSGSVVPIHYIDGALMAQMQDVTAIHDAIMPKLSKSIESIKGYNKAMFDINKQYNFLNEVLDMLNRVDVSKVKAETQIKIKNEEGEYTYESMPVSKAFEVLRKDLSALVETNNRARESVHAEVGTIGHMAGLPGSMWSNTAVVEADTKQKEGTISKIDRIQQELGIWFPVTLELEKELELLTDDQIKEIIEGKIACK